MAFVVRHLWVGTRKPPGRMEIPQFRERTVFEAGVNAVAHRDYSIRESAIRLALFDDRQELRSPGALPNTVTVESMRMRQPPPATRFGYRFWGACAATISRAADNAHSSWNDGATAYPSSTGKPN